MPSVVAQYNKVLYDMDKDVCVISYITLFNPTLSVQIFFFSNLDTILLRV